MLLKIIKTTDGKFVGKEYDVPDVTKEVVETLGMDACLIKWAGDTCRVSNSNYTVILKKQKD